MSEPTREEMLALADECQREFGFSSNRMHRIAKMLRAIAAKPDEVRERTAVEQFQNRIVEMIGNGFTGFHLATGPNWHALSVEERCKFILQMWDARGTPLNFGDSRRSAALNGEAKE